MSCWQQVLESDGRSHAELAAGVETLWKLHTLPAEGVAFLSTGTEGYRTRSFLKKGKLYKCFVGRKRIVGKW